MHAPSSPQCPPLPPFPSLRDPDSWDGHKLLQRGVATRARRTQVTG